jgi:hypothetical protein
MELKLKILSDKHEQSGVKTSDFLWYDNFYKKMETYNCNGLRYMAVREKYIFANNGDKIALSEAIKQIIDFHKNAMSESRALDMIKKYCEVRSVYRIKALPIYEKPKEQKTIDASKWFDTFANYNDTNIAVEEEDDEGVVVSFSPGKMEEWDDLIYSLDRERVKYQILSWRK